MRERRKLALAKHQLLIAKIAKREAMSALARSLDEEQTSAQLADKSRELAKGYQAEIRDADIEDFAARSKFASHLTDLVRDAGRARADAQEQAQYHREALRQSEAREDHLKEFAQVAKRDLDRRLEARASTGDRKLARRLLNEGGTPSRKPR